METPKTSTRAKSRRKKILIVAPHSPYPFNQGGNVRLWSLCEKLKSKYAFSLVSFVHPDLFDSPVESLALELKLSSVFERVVLVPQRTLSNDGLWRHFFDADVENHPDMLLLGERIQALLREDPHDLVQIEHVQMAACRRFIWNLPVVLTEHDVGWIKFFNSMNSRLRSEGLVRRFVTWFSYFWRYHRLVKQFNSVVLMSEADWDWWQLWGPSDVPSAVVPTGVDTERFAFSSVRKAVADRARLVFTGYYPHSGNILSVMYFLKQIWPLVKRGLPHAQIVFAGESPPEWLKRLESKEISVPGFVENLPELYQSADVFIAPSVAGGGIKGKILEAMACGLGVVATPLALAGFDEHIKEFVREASGPKSFAQNVIFLLKDSENLGKAREWVERAYGWDRCSEKQDRFYRAVLNVS